MAASTLVAPTAAPKSWLDRLLSIAAEIHPGEAVTALLLASNVFLLLCSYYILKPVREALILSGGGAEIKSYSGALQAGLLLFIIPAYGAFASRVRRVRLINSVTLFFISNLVLFYVLGHAGVPLGVPFFLWVGIFNVMVIAQFWSFANDVYTQDQGKRLFAIVGVGSAIGAVAGAKIAEKLVEPLGVHQLMLVAAGLLAVCLVLTNVIDVREKAQLARAARKAEAEQPLAKEGGFQLVFRQRYLLYIGLLTLTIQLVNTNGEYIMGRTFSQAAEAAVAAGTAGGLNAGQLIGAYYANFYFWQNLLVAVIQFFLVSRILKYAGVRGALFIPPVLSLGGYGLIAMVPLISAIRAVKLAENSTDYSLENTVRQTLFLPTSREAKYKGKQVVDSFFWRAGDMFSALGVFLLIKKLNVSSVAAINAGLITLWLLLAFGIAREHRKLSTDEPARAEAA
jgi:AAA family ATP:ADP antiporter